MSDEYDPKLYLCQECGFVIGIIFRGSERRPRLNVLRNGFHVASVMSMGDLREVGYVVRNMDAGDVTCGKCGGHRTWRMSDQAIDELIARRKKRTLGLQDTDKVSITS